MPIKEHVVSGALIYESKFTSVKAPPWDIHIITFIKYISELEEYIHMHICMSEQTAICGFCALITHHDITILFIYVLAMTIGVQ
jgi:hypothetical protein